MQGMGDAIMGIGSASGDNRAIEAAGRAINNPLLEDARIEGARNILVNVTGGEDFSLVEYEEIVNLITQSADPEALVIPGIVTDPSLGDEVRVTVVATGFNRILRPEPARKPASVSRGFDDFVSSEEWKRMTETPTQRGNAQYLQGRNDSEDELDIPTVLRDRRLACEKSES